MEVYLVIDESNIVKDLTTEKTDVLYQVYPEEIPIERVKAYLDFDNSTYKYIDGKMQKQENNSPMEERKEEQVDTYDVYLILDEDNFVKDITKEKTEHFYQSVNEVATLEDIKQVTGFYNSRLKFENNSLFSVGNSESQNSLLEKVVMLEQKNEEIEVKIPETEKTIRALNAENKSLHLKVEELSNRIITDKENNEALMLELLQLIIAK